MLKLNDSETKSLLAQPETGMGYQLVEATQSILKSSSYSTVLRLAESLGRAASLGSSEIMALRALPRENSSARLSVAREVSPVVKKNAGQAKEAPVEKTNGGEVFKRFSAYENDRRVTIDKRLLPGSYATTEEDAKNVTGRTRTLTFSAAPSPEPTDNRVAAPK